jgi:hypothetical protein
MDDIGKRQLVVDRIFIVMIMIFLPLNYIFNWASIVFYTIVIIALAAYQRKTVGYAYLVVSFVITAFMFNIYNDADFKTKITFLPCWFIAYIIVSMIHVAVNATAGLDAEDSSDVIKFN